MLDSFRNFTKSLVGKIVVFIVLGVIAIAFAAGDVTGLRGAGLGSGKTLATVGSYKITEAEVTKRLNDLVRALNNRGQPVTMAEVLQRGGFEYVLNQQITVHAIEEFAKSSGMYVDQTTIEADIANNPDFKGPDGKFSQALLDARLQDTGKSMRELRDEVVIDKFAAWLFPDPRKQTPIADGLVSPYASLFLERRIGIGTLIRPTDMDAGPAPDDKTLTAYYTRNKVRYQVPERRIMRYALVTPDQFKASATATDAEIAAAYKASGTRFAASEKRTVHQVIVLDKATADAVAADLKAGKAVADVAKARGVAPTDFEGVEKEKLATDSSVAVANAAFTGPAGIVGPVQTQFGWAVLKVEKIEKIPAKTLEQARPALADEIAQRKTAEALAQARQDLEDDIGNGATFDEAMRKGKLSPLTTPALIADGMDPDNPPKGKDAKPDETMATIAAAGFQYNPESQEPLVVPVGKDGAFAVVILQKIVPAAARPLASIRDNVLADYKLEQQLLKARKAAQDLRAELNKGTPMQEALAKLGIRALPPKAFNLLRGDLKQEDPPQTQIVFSTAPKTAKLVEAPQRAGYYVVYVSEVQEKDAKGDAAAMTRARTEFLPATRQEFNEQFVQSIQKFVVVTRNEANIAALKARLVGSGLASQ
jgi:peptidyl-prolyl cis-trans isomerase D